MSVWFTLLRDIPLRMLSLRSTSESVPNLMKKDSWPKVVRECARILRPGGVLWLIEVDHWGTTNAPAFSRLMDLTYQAVWFGEHSFDPSRRTFGVTPLLERLVRWKVLGRLVRAGREALPAGVS